MIKKTRATVLAAFIAAALMALAVGASVSTAATAKIAADANGCGTTVRINSDGSQTASFKNCGGTTLRRKAIVNNGYDGTCKSIPAHSTRWLVDMAWSGSLARVISC